MKSEIAEKTERIVKMLGETNCGGVLINSQPNFAWATAGANNGIDLSRETGAASILIRSDGKRFILASRIEMPHFLAEEVSAEDFEPVEFGWEDEKASPTFLTDRAISLLSDDKTLGADLPLSAGVQTIESNIARCRYHLTDYEIERYRILGKDAGETLGEIIGNLRGGESETEIANLVSNRLAQKNINSIVTLVAADERLQKFRHPVPTGKCWKKVLMIVVCARRAGLIASLSQIVCAGKIPGELARKTEAAARVNAKLLAATKPKKTGAELYKIAADAYAEEGFAGEQHLHHQGGATGYRARDWTAHPSCRETVEINQAFAWNPSITGTKAEETVICFENKIEVVTATPNFPQIAIEIQGREYLSPGILSL